MEYYHEFIKKIEKKPEKLAPALGAVAAAGLAAYAVKRIQSSSKPRLDYAKGTEEIPSPKGAVYYFGHLPMMSDMPAHTITKWHRELGPIIRVKMGVQDWVFISDPIVAQEVFAAQGSATSGRPYLTYGNGMSGEGDRGIVFTDYGKKWKNARTAILNILSPKSVDGFEEVLLKEADSCLNQLIEATKKDGDVNPLSYVRCSSVNVILTTGFGVDGCPSPEDPLFKKLEYIINTGIYFSGPVGDISAYLPFLSFLDVIFRKETKMRNFLYNESRPVFDDLVKAARKSDRDNLVKKFDLISEEYEIDDLNINVTMSEVLIAGGDTVAITTSLTYAILCHHPEVQEKLQQEVDAFIRKYNRAPTFEDRLEFPYYIAVQKECIRFRPPLYFGVPRKNSKDVVYKNYVIPAGTTLTFNVHTLHTDPEIFPEPEKFIPERFTDDTRSMYASSNGNVKNRDQYVFGWGRRICPGIYLAENELFNSITKVMARCNIEPAISPAGEKVYPDLDGFTDGGATLLLSPFKIRFVEREDRIRI